ncbi:hypothetical protein AVEN_1335-1 [Araneus ventricosus]|uniref:DUF4817 domain-containing protein n=1 Tax=Araneus ventricosus TaxID=182803 RepID=A0A4Y2D2Q2_ARAVE|nr:hypothetical protein AVEN_1335-1 [Araneus ventricosus]
MSETLILWITSSDCHVVRLCLTKEFWDSESFIAFDFRVSDIFRSERSPTATRRSFQKRVNVPKGPDAKTIRKLFAKFERTGSVDDNRVGNVGLRQTVVAPENVAKVPRKVYSYCSSCGMQQRHYWPFFMLEKISRERWITIFEQFVSTQLALEDRPRIE